MLFTLFLAAGGSSRAQSVKTQTDRHIVNQQERMVHKQWDRKKFTPTKGFLSLNYQYWITWALHPNYPGTDRRPLSAAGPQTIRQGLVLAMQQTEDRYKKHSDTLQLTALLEISNYSAALSKVDPIWQLYYRREFAPLLDSSFSDALKGTSARAAAYLEQHGLLEWYVQECEALRERLQSVQDVPLDRGSRMLAYHRMLTEYRRLTSSWEAKKSRASTYLELADKQRRAEKGTVPVGRSTTGNSDIAIAERILERLHP